MKMKTTTTSFTKCLQNTPTQLYLHKLHHLSVCKCFSDQDILEFQQEAHYYTLEEQDEQNTVRVGGGDRDRVCLTA